MSRMLAAARVGATSCSTARLRSERLRTWRRHGIAICPHRCRPAEGRRRHQVRCARIALNANPDRRLRSAHPLHSRSPGRPALTNTAKKPSATPPPGSVSQLQPTPTPHERQTARLKINSDADVMKDRASGRLPLLLPRCGARSAFRAPTATEGARQRVVPIPIVGRSGSPCPAACSRSLLG